jgi:hypothetical protein
MKPTKVQLGGKTWTVVVSRRSLKTCDGYCDMKRKRIVISGGLDEHRRREIFIHESEHARYWFLDEGVIEASAGELNEALDALGF